MLAVVIADAAEGEFRFERRKFGTLGTDLDELSAWLGERGVREVIMESTALYWKPVYRFLRSKFRQDNEDAKDLTQGFFTTALERDFFARFDPAKASFRTYLRMAVERFAASRPNIIVCKSMSKVYALSGVRVAYLCAGPHQLEPLRPLTPPWAVSLPGQVAAVEALKDANYYALRYRETHALRTELAGALRALNWTVIPGMANFLLCHLPDNGPNAVTVIARCRERGLFLRDASAMGSQLGDRAVRIAVKDPATNRRMIEILRELAG